MIIIKLFKTHTFIGKIGSALHFIKLHCSDSDKVPWLKSYMCVCPYIHICIKGMRVYYMATFFSQTLVYNGNITRRLYLLFISYAREERCRNSIKKVLLNTL